MLTYTSPAVTTTEAQAYVDARLLTGWPATAPEQTAALRRGQDYIAREYNHRWLVSFTDATAPVEVKNAIVEAALSEARSPGVLSPTVTAATAKVLTEVKGIKWEPVGTFTNGVRAMKPTLTQVDAMLSMIAAPAMQPAALVV
jgi:hypothetical protein